MPQDSLLKSLRKYPTSQKKDPVENFITEAFAWVLRVNEEFANYFLKHIETRMEGDKGSFERNGLFETQVNLRGVFPDMLYRQEGGPDIIFEHKVIAELHENQLKNYKENHPGEVLIVLITANIHQQAQADETDLALTWEQIYRLIDDWKTGSNGKDDHEVRNHMLLDFQSLLKSEGLGPQEPIKSHAILYYHSAINLEEVTKGFFEKLINDDGFINEVCSDPNFGSTIRAYLQAPPEGKRTGKVDTSDGRCGISLFGNSWEPGLYIGPLLKWGDHRVKPLDEKKGPDCSVIISFDKAKFGNDYEDDPIFQNFVKMLNNSRSLEEKGWDVHDHLRMDSSKNYWHPLHIRKPMFDVFKGTSNYDEQRKTFLDEIKVPLGVILTSEEFRELRHKYVDEDAENA